MSSRVRGLVAAYAPGLALAVGIAALARLIAAYLPGVLAEVTVALVLGIVAAQLIGASDLAAAGVRLATRWFLRTGIVLLGARLSLDQIGAIGLPAVAIIVVTMASAFLTVRFASRAFGVDSTLATLLAVGTAVCGNTAVIATAPIIGARGRDVAAAVATVSIFGTAAVLIYPFVGDLLGMTPNAFGLWAGVAINDTSQVVAAGAAYSPTALDTATVVKLIRNSLMAPVLIGIAWAWHRSSERSNPAIRLGVLQSIPLFVVGFVFLAALRSVGLIDPDQAEFMDTVAKALILVALSAVGLSIRAGDVLRTSSRPIAVGLCAAMLVGGGALFAIEGLGLGLVMGRW